MTVIMKCGHAANAYENNDPNKPCCVICAGIDSGYNVVMTTPDLSKRKARCGYYGARIDYTCECTKCKGNKKCQCEEPSSTELAFFEYRPDQPFDMFYCGCCGWN